LSSSIAEAGPSHNKAASTTRRHRLAAGGYREDELVRAGAYRVYADPADLLLHIDEVGGRR
jgi:hypothetical protein